MALWGETLLHLPSLGIWLLGPVGSGRMRHGFPAVLTGPSLLLHRPLADAGWF